MTLRGAVEAHELARFEALMLPHLDAAHMLARYWTRNPQDAEDIVQEAYLRALRYFHGYRGEGDSSARAWLLTIVRNTAYTSSRQRRVDALSTEFDDTEHSHAAIDDNGVGGDEGAGAKETVARALDRLPAEFREVIVLRELQGLSYKEISEVAGVPVGTVMSRLSRARARLQKALRDVEGE